MGTKKLKVQLDYIFESFNTGEVFQIVQGLPKDAKVMNIQLSPDSFDDKMVELEIWSAEFKGNSEELISIEVTKLDNRKHEDIIPDEYSYMPPM